MDGKERIERVSVTLLLGFRARKSPGAFADPAECPVGTREIPAFGGVVRTLISDSEIIGGKISKEIKKKQPIKENRRVP